MNEQQILDALDFHVGQLQNLVNEKSRKINEMHSVIKKLEKDNKKLKEYNIVLKDDLREFDNICSRLKNENEELKKRYEENVPIEEVVGADLKGMNVVDEDTVVRLMTNQFEHSEREFERLNHTIKSQKGIIKKQGKDISRLQKENKKLKFQLKKRDEEYKQIVWSNDIYKMNNKNLSIEIENEKLKNIICFGKDN